MRKKKPNILLNSKILVGVGVAMLLVLGLSLVAQGFIDTHNYLDTIVQAVRQQTGREITIKGKVSISLLPRPTIYIPSVELRDADSATPAPAITANMIRLRVRLSSLFSEHPSISAITLEHPVLELVRAKDNFIHWDWLDARLFKALAGNQNAANPLSLEIIDGRILYHDNRTDKGMTIDGIDARVVSGGKFASSGAFTAYGRELFFAMDMDAVSPENLTPFHFKMYTNDKNMLQLQGAMNLSAPLPEIKGTLNLAVDDMLAWARPKSDNEPQLLRQVTNQSTKRVEDRTPLPLKLTADWSQQGLSIQLANLQLHGLHSDGLGSLTLAWQDWKPDITSDMQFSTLDYNQWKRFFIAAFPEKSVTENPSYNGGEEPPENPLPKECQLSLHFAADQLYFGPQILKKAALSAAMEDASVTVNQFSVELPGVATLNLFGIISQGTTNGLRFEGSMETQGKSLRQMLTIFDSSASGLPETGFGDFYARSNIFVSSEQMRLSEAD